MQLVVVLLLLLVATRVTAQPASFSFAACPSDQFSDGHIALNGVNGLLTMNNETVSNIISTYECWPTDEAPYDPAQGGAFSVGAWTRRTTTRTQALIRFPFALEFEDPSTQQKEVAGVYFGWNEAGELVVGSQLQGVDAAFGDDVFVAVGEDVQVGVWQHVMMTLEPVVIPEGDAPTVTKETIRQAVVRVFVDAVLKAEVSNVPVPVCLEYREPQIGGGAAHPFEGSMDELRIFEGALEADEVAKVMRGESMLDDLPDGVEPVTWLTFRQQYGNRAYDRTWKGSDAAISRGVEWQRPCPVDEDASYLILHDSYIFFDEDAIDLSGSFTLSVWAKRDDLSKMTLFTIGSDDGDPYLNIGWLSPSSNGGVTRHDMAFAFNDTERNIRVVTAVEQPEHAVFWNYWAFVYDADARQQRLYLNGERVAQGPAAPLNPAASGGLDVGVQFNFLDTLFVGRLDELRVFTRAVSDDEVVQLFEQNSIGDTTGLVTWQRFNNRAPHHLTDDWSGNGVSPTAYETSARDVDVLCIKKDSCWGDVCQGDYCLDGDGPGNFSCLCEDGTMSPNAPCGSCEPGYFGLDCSPCPDCFNGTCADGEDGDGSCECDEGWVDDGEFPCYACDTDYFGDFCLPCPHCGGGSCNDGLSGNGTCNCVDGSEPDEMGDCPTGIALLVETHPTCSNASNGVVRVTLAAMSPPVHVTLTRVSPEEVVWEQSTMAASADFEGLPAGVYEASAEDANGTLAFSEESVELEAPPQLEVEFVSVENSSCPEMNVGTIAASAVGGTPPLVLELTDQHQNVPNLAPASGDGYWEDLLPGEYTLTVSDANGCVTEPRTIEVGAGPAVDVHAEVTPARPPFCWDGVVVLQHSGGEAPFTYVWNHEQLGGDTVYGVQPGTYDARVTDGRGCSWTGQVEVPCEVEETGTGTGDSGSQSATGEDDHDDGDGDGGDESDDSGETASATGESGHSHDSATGDSGDSGDSQGSDETLSATGDSGHSQGSDETPSATGESDHSHDSATGDSGDSGDSQGSDETLSATGDSGHSQGSDETPSATGDWDDTPSATGSSTTDETPSGTGNPHDTYSATGSSPDSSTPSATADPWNPTPSASGAPSECHNPPPPHKVWVLPSVSPYGGLDVDVELDDSFDHMNCPDTLVEVTWYPVVQSFDEHSSLSVPPDGRTASVHLGMADNVVQGLTYCVRVWMVASDGSMSRFTAGECVTSPAVLPESASFASLELELLAQDTVDTVNDKFNGDWALFCHDLVQTLSGMTTPAMPSSRVRCDSIEHWSRAPVATVVISPGQPSAEDLLLKLLMLIDLHSVMSRNELSALVTGSGAMQSRTRCGDDGDNVSVDCAMQWVSDSNSEPPKSSGSQSSLLAKLFHGRPWVAFGVGAGLALAACALLYYIAWRIRRRCCPDRNRFSALSETEEMEMI